MLLTWCLPSVRYLFFACFVFLFFFVLYYVCMYCLIIYTYLCLSCSVCVLVYVSYYLHVYGALYLLVVDAAFAVLLMLLICLLLLVVCVLCLYYFIYFIYLFVCFYIFLRWLVEWGEDNPCQGRRRRCGPSGFWPASGHAGLCSLSIYCALSLYIYGQSTQTVNEIANRSSIYIYIYIFFFYTTSMQKIHKINRTK